MNKGEKMLSHMLIQDKSCSDIKQKTKQILTKVYTSILKTHDRIKYKLSRSENYQMSNYYFIFCTCIVAVFTLNSKTDCLNRSSKSLLLKDFKNVC